jgi:hypothetical protein
MANAASRSTGGSKHLSYSIVQTASRASFSYTPPQRVYGVVRILVIVDQAQEDLLANVLRGFWRYTALTRILVTEHDILMPSMMNENMRAVDLSTLPMRPYENRVTTSGKKVIAPALLAEVDACVIVSTLDADAGTLPSLEALRTVSPNLSGTDIRDVFFALKHLIAGSVISVEEKVVWGDDLLEVDGTAYSAVKASPSPILKDLRQQLKAAASVTSTTTE